MKNIVIYDSGIGGIAIYRLIKKNLPNADFVYFADNANFPYGGKSAEALKSIAHKNIGEILSKHETDLVVLACNTITCVAVDDLRRDYPSAVFVGTEPSIKQAVQYTANNVLVVSTQNTSVNGRLKKRFPQSNIIWLALPNLAYMVENDSRDREMYDYIGECAKAVDRPFDCVVLGCTHYTLIKDLFGGVFAGKKIFDGAQGVAQHVKNLKYKEYRNRGQGITSLVLTNPDPALYQKYINMLRDY